MDVIKLSENESLKFEYYSGLGERCVYTYTDTDGEVFMTECPNGSEEESRIEKDQWLQRKKENKEEYLEFCKRYRRFMHEKDIKNGEAIWMNGYGFSFCTGSSEQYKKSDCRNVYLKYRFYDWWEASEVHGKSLEDCIAQIQEGIDSPTHIGDPAIDHIDKSTCKEFI